MCSAAGSEQLQSINISGVINSCRFSCIIEMSGGKVMKKTSKVLKNTIVDAVGLIILGLLLLIWSKHSLTAIFQITGIALIVIGILKWVFYFFDKEQKQRSIFDLVIGLIMIACGIFLFVRAEPLVDYFPAVSAIVLGYGAIRMITQAVNARMESMKKFLIPLIFGIILLVIATIVFVHPVFLLDFMVQVTGVAMMIEGVFMLILLLL